MIHSFKHKKIKYLYQIIYNESEDKYSHYNGKHLQYRFYDEFIQAFRILTDDVKSSFLGAKILIPKKRLYNQLRVLHNMPRYFLGTNPYNVIKWSKDWLNTCSPQTHVDLFERMEQCIVECGEDVSSQTMVTNDEDL